MKEEKVRNAMETSKYKAQKAERLAIMKEIRTKETFSNVRDYLVAANRISGQKRIESRMRVNQIIAAREEQKVANKTITTPKAINICANCLCRVCARNVDNDSNNQLVRIFTTCSSCNSCRVFGEAIQTEEECPGYLPDEMI